MRTACLILFSILLFSCTSEKKGPDVSEVKVNFQMERFEPAFFSMDTTQLPAAVQSLQQRFPNFAPFFLNNVLHVPAGSYQELKQILSSYRPVYQAVETRYRDLGWLQSDLKKGFQHVKYYYPKFQEPTVITFLAPFDVPGVLLTPQYLGIGLQQFAGKHYEVYQDPQIAEMYPAYISRRFDKEYMTSNAMKAIVDDIYPDNSGGRPLIEQMIEKGKQWYLLDLFLPEAADSVKTGFTRKQLDWCQKNEGNVWGFFTSNVDLYSIDPVIVQDYIGEGPFTRGMPEGFAPGNIGQWVGWQIVKKYAKNKEGQSVQQLMSTPAATIFQEAKYKPK